MRMNLIVKWTSRWNQQSTAAVTTAVVVVVVVVVMRRVLNVHNGRERFWGLRYENIAPTDIGSGQGLEITLWDIVNLLK